MGRSRPRRLLAALVGALLVAGCARAPQSILDPAGPVARAQYRLFTFDVAMVTGIGVVMAFLILYAVFRFRRRGSAGGLPPQVDGNRRLEIGWTLAAVLVLVPLAVEPIKDEFALAAPLPGQDVLQVRVVGHQWWWEFEYPDLGIVTANELHIPTGQPVQLTITSADVLHSFWVPRLGGKMDAVPGRQNKLWLQADEPGTYLGQCAELCGTSHANMRLRVIAQTAAEFEAWVRTRQNPVTQPQSDLAARGQAKFQQTCAACHTVDGTPAKGKVGPNLTGVGSRTTIAAGMLQNTDENLARWLQNPPAVKPGALMPNLNLKKEEIEALVAYLRGLK